MTQGETYRQRQTERHTDRETQRQRDTKTERHTDRERETYTKRQEDIQKNIFRSLRNHRHLELTLYFEKITESKNSSFFEQQKYFDTQENKKK